jgi:SAM-dependent methyltransferase
MLLDHLEGRDGGAPLLERDDGDIGPALGADFFFSESESWPRLETLLLEHARGRRVLDLGAGAGRHSLYLQERGHSVDAVDNSAGAVEVCRRRGVRHVVLADVTHPPKGPYDTVLMMCGNLGLAGDVQRTRKLLRTLHERTSSEARLLADSVDPLFDTDSSDTYFAAEQGSDRADGLVTIRIRYGSLTTRWFNLLCPPRHRLSTVVDGTGWAIQERYDDDETYGVVLRRLQ